MRISYFLVLWSIMFLVPPKGWCQGMPDLSEFKQPVFKCLKPSANLMISQVGSFNDPQYDLPPLGVVATVHASTDETDVAEIDHPTIQIYRTGCHLIYQQQFPGAGEATFETIKWHGLT